jgi:hypothetical protein
MAAVCTFRVSGGILPPTGETAWFFGAFRTQENRLGFKEKKQGNDQSLLIVNS